MPVSEQQKRQYLQMQGYNPDDYDLQEVGGMDQYEIKPRVKQQPTTAPDYAAIQPTQPSQAAESTATGAFTRGAATGVVPTLGGLAGAVPLAKAGAALGTPFGPIGTGIGGILGGLAGAFGGSYLADEYVQQPLLTDQFKEQLAQDAAQQPVATTVGRLGSSMIALRPDFRAIKGAGDAIRTMTAGQRAGAADLGNLLNVGVSSATGAAMPIVDAYQNDQPIDWRRVALETVGGAAINNPRQWTRAIGLTPNTYAEPEINTSLRSPVTADVAPNLPQQVPVPTSAEVFTRDPLRPKSGKINTVEQVEALNRKTDKMATYKGNEPLEVDRFEGEGGPAIRQDEPLTESEQRQYDFQLARKEVAEQTKRAKAEQEALLLEREAKTLQDTLRANDALQQERRTKPLVTTETGTDIMPDYTGVTEQANKEIAAESAEDLAYRRQEGFRDRYQEQEAPAKVGKDGPPNWLVDWANKQGVKRGISIDAKKGLVNESGMPINGRAYMENTIRKVVTDLDRVDTLPHELFHHFVDMLRRSPSPAQQALAAKMLQKVEQTPEFASYNAKRVTEGKTPVDAEEFLTQSVGELTVKELQKDRPFFSSMKSMLKARLSSRSSSEDIAHLMSYAMRKGESPETLAATDKNTTIPKTGDLNKDQEQTDRQKHKEIWAKIRAKQAEDKDFMMTDEFADLWQQAEALKNANDGITAKDQETDQANVDTDSVKPASTLERIFTPVIENVERKGGQWGKKTANALREVMDVARKEEAKIANPIKQTLKGLSVEQKETLYNTLYDEDNSGNSIDVSSLGNANIIDAYNTIRSTLKQVAEEQQKAGQPVFDYNTGEYRKRGVKDTYMPNIPSTEIIEQLAKGEGVEALQKEYVDYAEGKGYTKQKALDAFNGMREQWSSGGASKKPSFGAVRLSEGIGLPRTWLEKDLAKVFDRYAGRFAKDRAWHDIIEKDAEVSALLGSKQDPWGKERVTPEGVPFGLFTGDVDVANVRDQITSGGGNLRSPVADAVTRVANSLIMGPLTTAGNTISTVVGLAKYVKPTQQLGLLSSIKDVAKAYSKTFETGLNKERLTSVEDLMQPMSKFTEGADRLANTFNKYTGREKGEQINRALSQALSEHIISLKKLEAAQGDTKATKLLEKLANDRDWTKLDDSELATRLAERVEGTYDVRQLPQWVVDSNVAPYLKLARWSIGTFNNFRTDVFQPALKGELTPLFTSLFGATLGGLMLQEIREKATGKQGNTVTFKELEQAKDDKTYADQLFYKLATAAAYAGFAGIGSDLLRAALDKAHGNKPQTIGWPAMEVGFDVVDKVGDAVQAIKEGEDLTKVALEFNKNFLRSHVQAGRLLLDNISRAEGDPDFEATQSRNTKRKFEQLKGYKYQDRTAMPESPNPFLNSKEKEFKKERDPKKAMTLLEDILQEYMSKWGNDVEELKKRLSALKMNSYQTMPNLERDLPRFTEYYTFLKDTQGEDKARQILTDYLQTNTLNKAKSSVVPSI